MFSAGPGLQRIMIDSDKGSKKDQQRSYTAWVEGTRPKLLPLRGGQAEGEVRPGGWLGAVYVEDWVTYAFTGVRVGYST